MPRVCWLVVALVAAANIALADCPEGYPTTFPCVPGGTVLKLPAIPAPIVIPNERYLLAHPQQAPDLFEMVLAAASRTQWKVSSREVATEPSGPRYRAILETEQDKVSISVVPAPTGAYLLLLKALPK
jgi:hypothetical protein